MRRHEQILVLSLAASLVIAQFEVSSRRTIVERSNDILGECRDSENLATTLATTCAHDGTTLFVHSGISRRSCRKLPACTAREASRSRSWDWQNYAPPAFMSQPTAGRCRGPGLAPASSSKFARGAGEPATSSDRPMGPTGPLGSEVGTGRLLTQHASALACPGKGKEAAARRMRGAQWADWPGQDGLVSRPEPGPGASARGEGRLPATVASERQQIARRLASSGQSH